MTPTRLPRLPDELLHQIFSEKSLRCKDLASLALVSRRFLEPVRLCLYESIPIELMEVYNGRHELQQTFYGLPSWQLLRTAVDYPGLAALIKGLYFERARWRLAHEDSEKPDVGIVTTARMALTEFLRLAPNVNTVSAKGFEGYHNVLGAFIDFKNHSQITKLKLHSMQPAQGVSISREFVNLRHLTP